jgi:hypothetical protein
MAVAMVFEAKRPVGRMWADSRSGGDGAEAATTVRLHPIRREPGGGWAETYGFAVQRPPADESMYGSME